jgi:hypothetical protein
MPSASALFCDDIREEKGEKFSLMGVYSQALLVPSNFPTVIPKLCVFVDYAAKLSEDLPEPVVAKIRFVGQERSLFETILPIVEQIRETPKVNPVGHEITYLAYRFNVIFSPLTVLAPSTLEVVFPYRGEIIEAGSLEIRSGISTLPLTLPPVSR